MILARKKNFLSVGGFVMIALFQALFFVPMVSAEEYDVYVDQDASDGGDGSKEAPFQKIGEALEEALSNKSDERSIGVKKGVYKESLVLEDGVELDGEGRGSTVIEGTLTIKKKAEVENLTITTGAQVAVTVESGANLTLDTVEIKGFGKHGINALAGNGKIVVKKSAFHGSRGKGMYIQKGNRLEISDSRIYDNAEEGIDVRNNVDGFIKNNAFYENGEGGMEIIVGEAEMVISNNKFTKNRASGIATQFYATAQKDGKVQILDNVINNNGKYGIDCNVPSGGDPSPGYWARSLELRGNDIEDNGREEINKFCKIIEAVEADEEKDNAITETEPTEPIVEAVEADKPAPVDVTVLSEEDLNRERIIWDQVEALSRGDEEGENQAEMLQEEMSQKSALSLFLFGYNRESLEVIREESRKARERIEALKLLLEQSQNFQSEAEIRGFIQGEEEEIASWSAFIEQQEKKPGLFGWVKDLF